MTNTLVTGMLSLTMLLLATSAREQQPPPPCHPNPNANLNMATVRSRGDIRNLPGPLKDRLVQQAGRPHSQLPTQAYAEAHFDQPPMKPKPSQLFQYYLLDTTGFEPNPFTALFPGINDTAMLTATGPDCGLATIGSVRVVLEPKPGLPVDPNDVREFNYTTNWIHPLYELPFTGGIPGTFEAGQVGALQSIVPGSGPNGIQNDPVTYGDNPNTRGVLQASGPRDPDKFDAEDDAQREFRQRFIPSGLANEIFLDVYERLISFEPGVTDFKKRLFDAYAVEVARVDANGDGVVSAEEGDVDSGSDGFADNARLFIPATQFNRFAVTREINDGLLAPRFAPSQKAWVLSGTLVRVSPAVPASAGRDGDDR